MKHAGLWPRLVLLAGSVLIVIGTLIYALQPMFSHPANYLGVHDWDQVESYRYLLRKSIRVYHQFPFWNPYGCGGHTALGGLEADGALFSPLLPVYLLEPIARGVRIEVVVMTLWALAGSWLLASRFTRSHVICAFVAIVWTLNGRWALQTTIGRGWHLEYAWMPWVFYFFDRAVDERLPAGARRTRDVLLAAICFAMMVHMCGIYPVPHTALAIVLYATCLAVSRRSFTPLIALSALGALAIAFAGPKLFPMLDNMRRFPRVIESKEVFDPGSFLQVLTDPLNQDDPWWKQGRVEGQWHEWGMYLGWGALSVVAVGSALASGVRERAMLWVGSAMTLFALGNFDKYAPWTLLHSLPVFASQHVPSRWMYPALLPFACATASTGEWLLARWAWRPRARFFTELALLAAVGCIAFRMEAVARQPLQRAFTVPPPQVAESTGPFVMYQHVPPAFDYQPTAWVPTTLPGEMGNFGTTDCGTSPAEVTQGARIDNRRAPTLGARGVGDPEYRGEAFVAEGDGTAEIVRWTPNAVDVRVTGAKAGEHVVLNQNWDPGWLVDGRPAVNLRSDAAAVLASGEQVVHFRYRSPTFWVGILGAVLAAGVVTLVLRWQRKSERPAR